VTPLASSTLNVLTSNSVVLTVASLGAALISMLIFVRIVARELFRTRAEVNRFRGKFGLSLRSVDEELKVARADVARAIGPVAITGEAPASASEDGDKGIEPAAPSGSAEGIAAANLRLLGEYHAQGLAQARISFRFSLVFAALGFAIIASAILDAVLDNGRSVAAANIAALLGGTVIEAVSSLFFVQSSRARATMTQFFDSLRSDRAVEEAIRLSDAIPDAQLQSRLKAVLALTLAETGDTEPLLQAILGTRVLLGPTDGRRPQQSADASTLGDGMRAQAPSTLPAEGLAEADAPAV
jgi:hypothetical protein